MLTGARIWACFAVLFWTVGFFGVIDLVMLLGVNPAFFAVMGLEASWGVLFTFIVSGAFLAIAARPAQPWPAMVQLWLVVAALLLASVAAEDAGPLAAALMLLPMSLVPLLSRADRPKRANRRLMPSGPLLALALLGAPGWWSYAAVAVEQSLAPGVVDDTSWGLSHWPIQAALGLLLATSVLVMAFWPPGRTLLGTTTGTSAIVLGLCWLVYPDSAGAVHSPWLAAAAILWGNAVILSRFLDRPEPGPDIRRAAPAARPDLPNLEAAADAPDNPTARRRR
ncbi:hypothetical protein D477_008588 [Arthrobacter crystallopoietes BAB-32]|uniref:Uncharacterized protein n=1 Tax=Arthrobacter crystallopoietes BAB-32 TaxID=1246476 RepID=N1UZX0_9MICC|nr:hypothetical protein [Arthrobacter crystallopoietes]EMY34615.1 hypothetical protein D477_008588 [Arthrobacter crystallopoietes BAB-32]